MNMNPSQYLRATIGLFFVFILLFFGVAQASVFQKVTRGFSNTPQSKIEEVFGIVGDLGVDPKGLSKKEIRALVLALDDPTHLVNLSRDGLAVRLFHSGVDKVFFFSRFDLHKDSNALFTKLFFKKSGNQWKELPFEESRRNWQDFLEFVWIANREGHTQITDIDLEASAISFIHQRFSDRYIPNHRVVTNRYPYLTSSWDRQSLGVFFNNQLTIAHYINPHFTLAPENPYHYLIMSMVRNDSFVRRGENLSLINSKEFVLKIWSDTIREISRRRSMGISMGMSNSVFLERIIKSVIECRTPPVSSLWNHPFLKAMEEASRENDRLVQLVQLFGVIDRFVADNPEASYRNLLDQLRTNPDSKIDQIVYDFLFHADLENSVLQHSRHSDPADAGVHL